MRENKKLFGSLMLLLATVFWGASYSVQTMVADIGSFTTVFFKCIGGLPILVLALIKKEKFNKETVVSGLIIGVVCFSGCIFQQIGLELSSAANASFITSSYILMVPIFGLFMKKKVDKKIWFAIPITLVGMYLLCINGEFKLRIGDLLLLAGAACFALQIILIDKHIGNIDVLAFTTVQQLTAAFCAGIVMVVKEKPAVSQLVDVLPMLLYIALIAGAFAQFLQNRYQRDVDANLSSLLMSFESVFGAIFGWIILNQALSLKEIIGCVLIFISILIAE